MENFHAPEITVDKNGLWYSDGVPMINREIINLFASHLTKDEQDKFHIDWKGQSYPVKIEDAPFLAESITEQEGQLMIRLYDGREFPLPQGEIIMKNDIPYISLFWNCDTKLSQNSYGKLCEYAIERDGRFLFKFGGSEWTAREMV